MLWSKHDGDGKQLAAWQSMVSGFTAACLGPTVTNPFDVIKARAGRNPHQKLFKGRGRQATNQAQVHGGPEQASEITSQYARMTSVAMQPAGMYNMAARHVCLLHEFDGTPVQRF